ncbi:DUF502 domain-containing protein [Piscinibacter sakaiensis]|uniref:DUF502 domain-containing protein n=1 Tax=Piscinibacter sakaiensis TaxID=1547922 RepID=UPI003AAB8405
MTNSTRQVLRTFLTGLLAALPLIATVAVCVWAIRLLVAWFGPGSYFGRILVAIGLGNAGTEFAAYLVGMLTVLLLIFSLGILVQTRLRIVLARALNGIMDRIPLVGKIYDLAKKFVDLLAQRDSSQTRSMSPVWCHFGGPGGAAVLGLLSTPQPVNVDGRAYLAVLVPTAPVPVGGGLLYVPQEWVTPANLGAEAVTSIYVSMGITSSQHLGNATSDGTAEAATAAHQSVAAAPQALPSRPAERPDHSG